MNNLEPGQLYMVTTKHTFVFPFSHYEDLPNGQKVACFETPGETRFGKQYRKIVIGAGNVDSINKVE